MIFKNKLYKQCSVCKKNKQNWAVIISNRNECYCSNNCFFFRYRISDIKPSNSLSRIN